MTQFQLSSSKTSDLDLGLEYEPIRTVVKLLHENARKNRENLETVLISVRASTFEFANS